MKRKRVPSNWILRPRDWHYMTKSTKRRNNGMGLKKYKVGELIEFVEGKRLIIPRLCKSLKYCTILCRMSV